MTSGSDPFVTWLRAASPYIHAHRGSTFVLVFSGEAVATPEFPHFIHDLALLHGLGIRLVLIHGARSQIAARLHARGAELRYVDGLRITDATALACVKEAAGVMRIEIEALLSMGLANSPMAGVRIRVASGNFVIARPLGVRNGIDYCHTGLVRRIDAIAIRQLLDAGAIVLLSPLGYSPTGEVFNLSARDLAAATAIALMADKLIDLLEGPGLQNEMGQTLNTLTPAEVNRLLTYSNINDDIKESLRAGLQACSNGVKRVHLISRPCEGALLRELFTRDGTGTLITAGSYEITRSARIEDVGGILELISPLEQQGVLVRRSREVLEIEIECFSLIERDGMVIACAALYPYPTEVMGELACLAVHPDYGRQGRGEKLLEYIEIQARHTGLKKLFVLTTQTAHWFQERGFIEASLSSLPMLKQALYNYQRNSKVFVKTLE